jgi:hypothetical protein
MHKNPTKIAQKITKITRRNHESFHTLGDQILYKMVKNSKRMEQGNEKQSSWMVCPETLELYIRSSYGKGK